MIKFLLHFKSVQFFLSVMIFSIVIEGQPIKAQVKAVKADDFVNSVGVNTHWSYPDFINNRSEYVKKLGDLGIRYVRDGVNNSTIAVGKELWNSYGIKTIMLTGQRFPGTWPQKLNPALIDGELNLIKQMPYDAIMTVEYPNEYDISSPSNDNWIGTLKNYMSVFHSKIKLDTVLNELPIIGPSFTSPQAYSNVGDLDSIIDYSCIHAYQSNRHPGTSGWGDNGYGSITWALRDLAYVMSPSKKPVYSTECGYRLEGSQRVNEKIMGKYMVRMCAEYFRNGINPTIYMLAHDGEMMGLLDENRNERESYKALSFILNTLKEPGIDFTLGMLDYKLSGNIGNVRQMLFQKSNGDFYLMVWNEVESWYPSEYKERINPPVAVTLSLNEPVVSVSIYEQQEDGFFRASVGTVFGNKMSLSIPDRMTLIKISKSNNQSSKPTKPKNLEAMSGNNLVVLRWNAVTDANSYEIKRGTTAGGPYNSVVNNIYTNSFADSTAINGAKYYYVVSAKNDIGASYSDEIVANPCETCGPYDLVVTNIGWSPGTAVVNKDIRFSATLKNTGGTPTPEGLVHGVIFYVNKIKVSCSSNFISSLAPGASVTLTANSCPTGVWKVRGNGDFTIEAVVDADDILKDELDENNNRLSKILSVGGSGCLVPVTGVEMNKEAISLFENDSYQLIASLIPENACDLSVSWNTSDALVAKVDETGKVTALAEGIATISAISTDGNKIAECSVNVKKYNVIQKKYEAENGTISGTNIQYDAAASNGKAVGNLHVAGSYCEIRNIEGGIGGEVTLEIVYANGSGSAVGLSFLVNGKNAQVINFAPSGGWTGAANYGHVSVKVQLNKGITNTIRIATNNSGGVNVDYINVFVRDTLETALKPEYTNDFSAKFYPNPVSSFAFLDIQTKQEMQVLVSVYNMVGMEIFRKNVLLEQQMKVEFDLSEFKGGSYIIQVNDGANILFKDLWIKK